MSTFLKVTAGVQNGREWRGCWRHLCRRSLLNASGDVFVQPCVSSTRWHSLQNFILPPGCEKIFLHYVTDRILKLGFRPSLYWRSSLPFKLSTSLPWNYREYCFRT
ncbi:hypothetical protein O3P69_016744 [Scylla paramamosain]|uniref:Uncharacterized protein n=1 Tax=Scylla paramamosain TaxID=85552 RepID=A0AAW0T044_SCYPA